MAGLSEHISILIQCDLCGEKSESEVGCTSTMAIQDFTEDGWVVKGDAVACPACAEDE